MPHELDRLVDEVISKLDSELSSLLNLSDSSDDDNLTKINASLGQLVNRNKRLMEWHAKLIDELENNKAISQYVSPGLKKGISIQKDIIASSQVSLDEASELISLKEKEITAMEDELVEHKQQELERERKLQQLTSEIKHYRDIERRYSQGEILDLETDLHYLKVNLESKEEQLLKVETKVLNCEEKLASLVESLHEKRKLFSDWDGLLQLEIDIYKVINEFETEHPKQQLTNIQALKDRVKFTETVSKDQLSKHALDKLDDITLALDKIDDEIRQALVVNNDA